MTADDVIHDIEQQAAAHSAMQSLTRVFNDHMLHIFHGLNDTLSYEDAICILAIWLADSLRQILNVMLRDHAPEHLVRGVFDRATPEAFLNTHAT
jgi:hypothetical protein